jgi:uncharacterized protein
MIRLFIALILCVASLASPASAESPICAKPLGTSDKFICADPALSALAGEATRLADLAAGGAHMTPARRKELKESGASFRKTLVACGDARPCLQRTLVARIHELRQAYADARSKDGEGTSRGPFVAVCPGLDALIGVTFVNGDPAFAFLAWRDKSVVLQQAVSASGARYTGAFGTGEAQFWNKGKEATLDLPGKLTLTCSLQEPG